MGLNAHQRHQLLMSGTGREKGRQLSLAAIYITQEQNSSTQTISRISQIT
jgi:hypothetical protein